jgi:hypothetical protein
VIIVDVVYIELSLMQGNEPAEIATGFLVSPVGLALTPDTPWPVEAHA